MPSDLIDICVNLAGSSFQKDLDEVLQRAADAGVSRMLVTASNIVESHECLSLAKQYSRFLWSTAGVHPHHASEWNEQTADEIRALAVEQKVVALGECGLDYNRNFSTPEAQRTAFHAQLALATELELPVLLHERDAHDDFISIIKEHQPGIPKAVLHCFTGNRHSLENCLEAGMHIGVTGWVCDERRGQELAELVPLIPSDRLVIETDSPYLLPRDLSPKPKSRRNEPAFLAHIAQRIAALREISPQQLAEETTRTALDIFDFK